MPKNSWFLHHAFFLDLFCVVNLAFLGLDIYIAHSANDFADPWEWAPLLFSAVAFLSLAAAFPTRSEHLQRGWRRTVGLLVGAGSIAVGVAGLVFHLKSQFFVLMTIQSLVYTAPFVAPLAYTGVGLLLLMNRTVPVESPPWPQWVIALTFGGIVGNFVLALCDHAQNGFFRAEEWIPVVVSAYTAGFLAVSLGDAPKSRAFLRGCIALLALNALTGVVGLGYHVFANLEGVSANLWDNFIHGAPAFAPLLMTNLSVLGALGFWRMSRLA